jgi:multidrug efflux pump subunit AcrA (membrane-fusion protein)
MKTRLIFGLLLALTATAGSAEPTAGSAEPTAGSAEPTAGSAEPTVASAEPTAQAQQLTTITVQPHAVDLTFPAESLVEAVQQTTVGAQIAGRVLEVKADAGQSVKKGDLLMRIDAREAAEAARGAEAQYINAKATYDRSKSLKDQKFLSQAAVDKARADLDAAAANRSAAGASQSHANILAPISGMIARRHAELGDMATPGKPLFTIYEPGGLRVTASIPQYRLKEMRNVTTARVEFPELGKWVDGDRRDCAADRRCRHPRFASPRFLAAGAGSHARHVRPRPFRARPGQQDDRAGQRCRPAR